MHHDGLYHQATQLWTRKSQAAVRGVSVSQPAGTCEKGKEEQDQQTKDEDRVQDLQVRDLAPVSNASVFVLYR